MLTTIDGSDGLFNPFPLKRREKMKRKEKGQ